MGETDDGKSGNSDVLAGARSSVGIGHVFGPCSFHDRIILKLPSAAEWLSRNPSGPRPDSGASNVASPPRVDQCYRGRDHLLCSFNAILAEADYLVQNYHEVTSANYPETANINEACMKAPDRLASDLQIAADFTVRYKALKTAYEARASCAARVQKAVSEVVLTDVMTQAPSIVSSMVDTIRADLQPVATAAATAAEVSQRIEASYKAILTLQKVHRAMCLRPEGSVKAIGAPDNGDKL